MIDHFNLPVSDLERSRSIYVELLRELGYSLVLVDGDAIGFGHEAWSFGIVQENNNIPEIHVALKANSHDEVEAFYRKALDLGLRSNGAPGLRLEYGPGYYSAYAIDPDGHNLEAVCRGGVGSE